MAILVAGFLVCSGMVGDFSVKLAVDREDGSIFGSLVDENAGSPNFKLRYEGLNESGGCLIEPGEISLCFDGPNAAELVLSVGRGSDVEDLSGRLVCE